MRRFFSVKIGLACILSCLALMLGMFATTGTASAHTAGIHPFINIVSSIHRLSNCVTFTLEGGGFTPNHHVDLFANGGGSIDPDRVRTDGDGRFLADVTACENFDEFSSCGGFIESFNFCGFNLPQNDFCGISSFNCSGFIGSTLKAVDCSPQDPMCSQGPGENNGGNPCLLNPESPNCQQGGPGPNTGNTFCQQNPNACNPGGQGNGDTFCQQHPDVCNHNGQGNGDTFCQQHPDVCNHNGQGNGNSFCERNPELCGLHRPHRFHVPLFDFCRFHRDGLFPFCFRFFREQFPLTIVITAVDESTGRRAHVGLNTGGF